MTHTNECVLIAAWLLLYSAPGNASGHLDIGLNGAVGNSTGEYSVMEKGGLIHAFARYEHQIHKGWHFNAQYNHICEPEKSDFKLKFSDGSGDINVLSAGVFYRF